MTTDTETPITTQDLLDRADTLDRAAQKELTIWTLTQQANALVQMAKTLQYEVIDDVDPHQKDAPRTQLGETLRGLVRELDDAGLGFTEQRIKNQASGFERRARELRHIIKRGDDVLWSRSEIMQLYGLTTPASEAK